MMVRLFSLKHLWTCCSCRTHKCAFSIFFLFLLKTRSLFSRLTHPYLSRWNVFSRPSHTCLSRGNVLLLDSPISVYPEGGFFSRLAHLCLSRGNGIFQDYPSVPIERECFLLGLPIHVYQEGMLFSKCAHPCLSRGKVLL